ncbi:MAG TPA: hypothetical protein VGU45_07940 [Microvirga sp.]|jgi:hypothetical protein|nr:hypothetical protein [Microvirga sp.]
MPHPDHAFRKSFRAAELSQLPEIVTLSALIGLLSGGLAWLAFG